MRNDVHAVLERHAVVHAGGDEIIDIAREAPLVCLDALVERRLARQPKGTAGLRLLLEHGDAVAVGDQRGIGQARRARADYGDALTLRRPRVGEDELTPGGAVDHAADAGAAAHLVDAGVAGEAAPNWLA